MIVWNPLKISCPICGKIIRAKTMINNPRIIRAKCENCGWLSKDYKNFVSQ